MPENQDEQISALRERVAKVEQSSSAAHARLDKSEQFLREDLASIRDEIKKDIVAMQKSIKDDMKEISDKTEEVVAWMNKGYGVAAILLSLAGAAGWFFGKLFNKVFGN